MFQPGAVLNTQGFGIRPENVEVPHLDVRAPSSTDTMYPIGKRWIYPALNASYVLTSQSSIGGQLSSTWTSQLSSSGVTVDMTTGAVTVSNPSVTANSIIVFSRKLTGGTAGQVSISAQSAGSFTLTSTSGSETSNFSYIVIN